MNQSSDAAEQIVRLSLEGFEVAAKISGTGAKNVAVLLYTLMKDKQKTAGKTNLTNMLKSGKELKVFSVKASEFQKFTQEAKRYGVLYSALINKRDKNQDGVIDIMVRAEDASKINRIVERFKLASFNKADIVSDIEKHRGDKNPHSGKTRPNPQSKPFSKSKSFSEQEGSKKHSVRDDLNKYRDEIRRQTEKTKARTPKTKSKPSKKVERSGSR